MTGPTESSRVRQLVDQLARGDRTTALALHALISAADATGVAEFDIAAKVYRDDHLGMLRATGRDAEREAGRLVSTRFDNIWRTRYCRASPPTA